MKQLLQANVSLYVSGLSQSELIHVIEKEEKKLFNRYLDLKEFRHNHPNQRASVVREADLAWKVVENMAQVVDLRIDSRMTARVITRLQACALDGYDLVSAEAMFEHGIPQVLTDDGDFACVEGIHLFTANPNVINAAATQGKLVAR